MVFGRCVPETMILRLNRPIHMPIWAMAVLSPVDPVQELSMDDQDKAGPG